MPLEEKKFNISRILFIGLIGCSLTLAVFLSVNLILFYFKNVQNYQKGDLVYVFKEKTFENDYVIDVDADMSEQFLSYGISYGVDVSEWQGEIDWEKVAATGISFAMIRCGFREIVGSEVKEDANFRTNIEGARAAGLNVGVYFFGTAKNQEEALEEAEFTFNLIKDYNLTYPVVYDIESFNDGRLKYVDYSTISDNVLTFTEALARHGYDTMVYSYKSALTSMLDMGKFDGKLIWLAHFVEDTDYKGNYNMWQYTDVGKVDGISTYVDLNISYFKYVDDERLVVQNPNYVESPKVEFSDIDDEVRIIRNSKIRASATTEIPNTLGNISYGTVVKRTGVSEHFSRIIYNERVVYIENDDIRAI